MLAGLDFHVLVLKSKNSLLVNTENFKTFIASQINLGGVSSCAEKAPWNVLISRKDTRRRRQSSGPISVLCGGSLVTQTHVVTAAHCVWANRCKADL